MKEKKSQKGDIKKIMFVNLEGQMSGAEKSMLLTIKHLTSGFQPQVACPKTGELIEQLEKMKVNVLSLPQTPKKYNYLPVWTIFFVLVNIKILWMILLDRPKLIHANTTKAALASLLGTVLLRIKLVWHVRDAEYPKWVLRLCSSCSMQIIVVSNSIRIQLVAGGVKISKIKVINNSVDITQGKQFTKNDVPEGPFTFANIGQFVPWKKQMLYVEAAEAYLERGNRARFLIIGSDVFGRDAEYEKLLRKRIAESCYSGSFEIIPWQKELNPLWQGIDCLVHTADKEPFGRVIIEAMREGIPVIAADAFGPSEILQDCITGFLFEPGDIAELYHCMEVVFQNPDQVKEVVLAGYQYVCQKHNIHKAVKQIQNIYLELLAA